jgi:hypothetical protein
MKRSWVIPALMIGSVASAVLLLFSFVSDFLQLLTHYYLVPVSFTGTLWNVIGLVPTPASLIGLLPSISSDPILTPHYRPFTFFFVQIVAAPLCFAEAYGLRRRQPWALYAIIVFLPVDLLLQASSFSAVLRMQWNAVREVQAFLPAALTLLIYGKRMILKMCVDSACAAALLLGGYGRSSLTGEAATSAIPSAVPTRLAVASAPRPHPLTPSHGEVVNDSWVRAVPPVAADTPVLRLNRMVFHCAIACVSLLILLLLFKPPAPASSQTQPDIDAHLFPSFLLALLDYGLVAWHTRRQPERFALGLACACSLAVSAAGFMTAPVLLFAFFQRSSVAAVSAGAGSSLMTMAMLCLLFILGNFVMLLASLRTSWLAQSEATNSPLHWILGFAFPFATLMALRGIFSIWP